MEYIRRWPALWGSVTGGIGLVAGVVLADQALPIALLGFVGVALFGIGSELSAQSLRPFVVLLLIATAALAYVGLRYAPFPVGESVLADIEVVFGESPTMTARGWRVPATVSIAGRRQKVLLEGAGAPPGDGAGATVRLTGVLRSPSSTATFSEEGYFRSRGFAGRLVVDQLIASTPPSQLSLVAYVGAFRAHLLHRLGQALIAPADGLAAGVLFGIDAALDEDIVTTFRRTGMSHVLVASGTNVLILLAVALSFRTRLWLSLGAIGFFVLVAGAEASIVRASVFAAAFLLARVLGRRTHAPTTIALVVFGMGLLNPWMLVYDIGFQLSFAAVVGLVAFGNWLHRSLPSWALREYLAPTLAAQVTTLPVIAYHFGQVSVIAPLANSILLPLMPLLMATSAVALVVPWVRLLTWTADGLAQLFLAGTSALASVPWAAVNTEPRQFFFVSIACVPLLIVCVAVRRWPHDSRVETTGSWYDG